MLDYGTIRNLYKGADNLESGHLVVAEWNMNKYIEVKEYGLYKGAAESITDLYIENSTSVIKGKNYLIYSDGSKKTTEDQEFFSELASVFKPNRPDPGIILLQKFGNMVFAPKAEKLKVRKINPTKPRYYPFSKNRTYDYFNSAKILDYEPIENKDDADDFQFYQERRYGISDPKTGRISNANPFVVYKEPFPCNKIRIKVQNHLSVPEYFMIDVLINNIWTRAYGILDATTEDFESGILDIYYDKGQWSKTINRIDDVAKLNDTNSSEFVLIQGVRLRVRKMKEVLASAEGEPEVRSSASLELIEISPRLEIDMSSYTESFSIDSTIGDSTSFGLPVGSVVIGTGNIVLYNEDQQFLFSSTLTDKKMLNQDVKFSFYQQVYVEEEGDTFNIPIKTLYSNSWTVSEDYSVSVELEDGFKFLRELRAPDLLFSSNTPYSVAILMLLDNVGVTGLEFKKSSNAPYFDKEDTGIKSFFCSKEQSVLEVLQNIALATQCSMYYDAVGRLNVLTKEKLTENVSIEESSIDNPNGRTDFWMLGDEKYEVDDEESTYLVGYKSNIASFSEEKINPITDGDIAYHYYGPKKEPLSFALQKENKKIWEDIQIENFPMNALAFSSFDYATSILWQPGNDSNSVLAAANLVKNVSSDRIKDIFNQEYYGTDEEDAIRNIYQSINNDVYFPNDQNKNNAKRALVIYLDANEGFTFTNFEGKVLIDKEYIEYRGILYYLASSTTNLSGYRIIFSREEFEQMRAAVAKNDTISFKGLIISPKLKIDRKSGEGYIYKVINDGRGKFGSDVREHIATIEGASDIEKNKQFKLTLGEDFNYATKKTPGELTTSMQFNFMDLKTFRSAKNALGTLPPEAFSTYLGFLRIYGPNAPKGDAEVLNSVLTASGLNDAEKEQIYQKLNETNKQVDAEVPGKDFDDYVFMLGERNLYGQKITLPFTPNSITTRMRLYSPRKKTENFGNIMSTNSSIAGIAFGLNEYNEGYYLEVETAGSGKNFVEEEAYKSNLRFYKITLGSKESGKPVYTPKLLLKGSVEAYTTFDVAAEIRPNDQIPLDPVFELDIDIEVYYNATKYIIKYGDTVIGSYIESAGEDINTNSKNIAMFVRNDSQAIYEYIGAAARPVTQRKNHKKDYFASDTSMHNSIDRGIIPVGKHFLFKDDEILFYFNDFARLVREVKEYDIRFNIPAFSSALIDVSKINPKYFVKSYKPTAFGAKLTVVNSSFGAVTISSDSTIPLYVVGIPLEELTTGTVSMEDVYDLTLDDKLRTTEREKNISIFGSQSFSLDSPYIQSMYTARNLMRWASQYCGRQRLKVTMETYPIPILELGDKVRLFDKTRGYYINNPSYGDKTFTVSSISHSVTNSGPAMTISMIEVGE